MRKRVNAEHNVHASLSCSFWDRAMATSTHLERCSPCEKRRDRRFARMTAIQIGALVVLVLLAATNFALGFR